MKPLPTGITLSLTLAVFYSLCTLIWAIWPDPFISFMNALFHGLDFRALQSTEPYTWSSFFYALVVTAAWGFALGAYFAWLHNLLSKRCAGDCHGN